MTRIKYTKSDKGYTSKYYTNYEGTKLIVFIYSNENAEKHSIYISDDKKNILEHEIYNSLAIAKRKARTLLIHKYNVRLNEEIRS